MTVSATRVAAFSFVALVLTAASIQLAGVVMGTASGTGQEIGAMALALPAFWAFLILLFLSVLLLRTARFELLTRADLLCVLFVGLLAAPLMSVGFWRFLIPSVATFPRGEDFFYLDTVNPKLWPHGPNLTEGILEEEQNPRLEARGRVHWETLALADGGKEPVPVIEHTAERAESTLRVGIPLARGTKGMLIPGESYLLSVLSRAENLGLQSFYYCRVYYDESAEFDVEVFTTAKEAETSFIQKEGFRRAGVYGLVLPRTLERRKGFRVTWGWEPGYRFMPAG